MTKTATPISTPWGQATLVEEWAVGTQGRATVPITGRAMNPPIGMQENDPYFAYVANNIRMGLA